VGQSFSTIPMPEPPVIRKGASGTFYDKGLEGASHHAVIPNVNTIDKLPEVWPRLSSDEKKLFDVIARAYLAALMPDFRYRQTTATLDVRGFEFRAAGRQPIDFGWRTAFLDWHPAESKGDEAGTSEGSQGYWHAGNPSRNHRRTEETGFSDCPGKAHCADRGRPVAVRYSQTS
jgi:DNA topoisomerase-3